jgi:hypothetical protein
MQWANIVNAIIGIWFIIAPFVLQYQDLPNAMWTSIAGGVLLLVLAGWAALKEDARKQKWIQYVNGLVGIWFIIFPFVLTLSDKTSILWTSVIGGAVALILSGWLAFSVLPREVSAR